MMNKKNIISFTTLAVSLCVLGGITAKHSANMASAPAEVQDTIDTKALVESLSAGAGIAACSALDSSYLSDNDITLVQFTALTEDQIYSYLQGPKSYSEGRTWSGEWSGTYVNGCSFGSFGCGLCCMANIYSTLTDYTCSPLDICYYAMDHSGYYPSNGVGAISWGALKQTLRSTGFTCNTANKPNTYEEFQAQVKAAQTTLCLISSNNDDSFWQDTPGHYITIWAYHPETDEVFLCDPGAPTKNRTWVPLKNIYKALKTSSQRQYITVTGYSEELNQWKHNGNDATWNAPVN